MQTINCIAGADAAREEHTTHAPHIGTHHGGYTNADITRIEYSNVCHVRTAVNRAGKCQVFVPIN